MKKPFLLLSLLLTFGLHADCAAWGTVGHRAIAEVAQRHLTPKAKAAIEGNDAKSGWCRIGSNDQNCTILVICVS